MPVRLYFLEEGIDQRLAVRAVPTEPTFRDISCEAAEAFGIACRLVSTRAQEQQTEATSDFDNSEIACRVAETIGPLTEVHEGVLLHSKRVLKVTSWMLQKLSMSA